VAPKIEWCFLAAMVDTGVASIREGRSGLVKVGQSLNEQKVSEMFMYTT